MLTKQKLFDILSSRFSNDVVKSLPDIYKPDIFFNINKAANFVKDAVLANKKIAIVGDYDVDGVASCAILELFFRAFGKEITVVIPNRHTDGYGLNPNIAKNIECDLLITVDNGISAFEASSVCDARGIDLIILDHHALPQELPSANFIIHPEFSNMHNKQVCACLVVWYFIGALKQALEFDFNMRSLIDIVAIATVADVMPLTDINRIIVKAGIKEYASSNAPYVNALKEMLGVNEITSRDIGFKIAPRLNCAGRLTDARLAFDFLTAKSLSEAKTYLQELDTLNNERRNIEQGVTKQALESIVHDEKDAIVVWGNNWSEGVVGIVAARLTQKYELPSFVLNINGDDAKGSARAPHGYDLSQMLSCNAEIFTKFGGHKLAAGFSLKTSNLETLKTQMKASAVKSGESLIVEIGEIDANEIDFELLELIDNFEPFGEGNIRPVFIAKNAIIVGVSQVGKLDKYTKLVVEVGNKKFEILHKEEFISFTIGDKITFSYTVSKNIFMGKASVQMRLEKIF